MRAFLQFVLPELVVIRYQLANIRVQLEVNIQGSDAQ